MATFILPHRSGDVHTWLEALEAETPFLSSTEVGRLTERDPRALRDSCRAETWKGYDVVNVGWQTDVPRIPFLQFIWGPDYDREIRRIYAKHQEEEDAT